MEVQGLGKLWSHMKPTSFEDGDVLDIHVGQLWSLVRGTLPYDWYSLRWCESTAGHTYDNKYLTNKETYAENNDSVNERIHETPYIYRVGEDKDPTVLCNRRLTR